MDHQFNAPEVLFLVNSIHRTYRFAPPYKHELIGMIKRMHRTLQDKISCAINRIHKIKNNMAIFVS